MKKANNIESYLTFQLGEEEYAAHVSKVLNILEITEITKVPKSPEFLKGVINLRGMVLPVIDTRLKLNMEEAEYTDVTCIIVMDIEIEEQLVHVGIIVDQVVAVLEIAENEIKPPPSIGNSYSANFITGIAHKEENFIMILDVIKLLSVSDLDELSMLNKRETAS